MKTLIHTAYVCNFIKGMAFILEILKCKIFCIEAKPLHGVELPILLQSLLNKVTASVVTFTFTSDRSRAETSGFDGRKGIGSANR